MIISHLGAKNCVTGSCHFIETAPGSSDGINILVDCGRASGDDPELPFDQFPVPPKAIQYLFLTHAHIDHIGRVPDLIEAGFCGEIICTHATKALLLPMLRDTMSFSHDLKKQRSDDNSSRKSCCPQSTQDISPARPQKLSVNALETLIDELSWGFELHQTFTLRQGVTFKLSNAGHILGSYFILFAFPGHQGKDYRVIFSGDLGCTDTPILPDPDPPEHCDLLILESTYGDRNHPNRKNRIEALRNLLHKALADKGIVYIPAFALGRTQELLYELDRIGVKVPVFVDSPLGLEITEIYSSLEPYWDQEAKDLSAKGDDPLDFKGLYAVRKYQDHQKLLALPGPAIIIAGSGMCTGGRIVDHLEQGLGDPANDIVFVGYQAKGTPGRKMIEGKIPIRATIHTLTGYSAHADQQMLADWVKAMPEPPGEIRLVHGDADARKALAQVLGVERCVFDQ